MTTPSIYDYADARDYLRDELDRKQQRNASFSVRGWARQMGLPHHALLSMVLNKKRRLRGSLVSKIRSCLGLQGNEARYFDLLVAYNNAEDLGEKEFFERLLRQHSPEGKPFQELTLDTIRLVSRWVHTAILEMTALKDFNSDPRWIASRLGDSVKPLEVEEALATLLRLGLLERQNGKLQKTNEGISTPNDVPNEHIRTFHRQMIEKANHALDDQPVESREIRGVTLAVRREELPRAKKLLREFMKEFTKAMTEERIPEGATAAGDPPTADAVYQLNLQFFSLTSPLNDDGETRS